MGTTAGEHQMFVHQRFLRQAHDHPTAVAIRTGGQDVTYAELLGRAEALAQVLADAGVVSGDVVGVGGQRGTALIVGMLAVCFVDAVYLPLDDRYPDAQLTFMLTDSGARRVVCTRELADRLREHTVDCVPLRPDGRLVDQAPRSGSASAIRVPRRAAAETPLYIIYTSGSSGVPKGVVVTHHNVARLFDAAAPHFGFAAKDVWTFFHSFAFDFSVWEIWGALLHGGTLVIVDFTTSRDPWAFYRLVVDERVTVLNQTPLAFAQFDRVDAAQRSSLSLRTVIFGGERLPMEALADWWSRHDDRQPHLVNMYGITETTVHVTYRLLTRSDLENPGSPVGVPLSDLEVSLRDSEGRPVPVGERGEIYVAGDGVTLGYVDRPDFTAQRFVHLDGRRWYRSGDLATWRDGELEIHGRIDSQVKIRGHRVELGQVEATLAAVSGVIAVRVLAQPTQTAGQQLIGYVIATDAFSTDDARVELSARLPAHMVPAAIIVCKQLPLTINGKLDRSSLPGFADRVPPAGSRPANSPTATILAEIWRDVLELDSVEVDDNFFALGGDSLLAVEVVARASTQGLTLSVASVFAAETIAGLAALAGDDVLTSTPTLAPFGLLSPGDGARLASMAGIVDAFPMTPLQLAMAFHSMATDGTAVYQNTMETEFSGPFEPERFEAALASVIARHPMLRTSLVLAGFDDPLQVVYEKVTLPLTVRWTDRSEEVDRLAHEWSAVAKAQVPQVARAPLVSVHVVATSDRFIVCWRVHHAIMDGWSDALFISELMGCYLDGPTDLDPVPTAIFADHVRELRDAAESDESLRFWRRALRQANPTFLPPPPEPIDQPVFPKHHLGVCDETRQLLQGHASRLGLPVKSFYLAAFASVVGVRTGIRRPTVGVVLNTRPESTEGTRAIGLFLNTVPLTLDRDAESWTALVRQAFDAEAAVLAHRAVALPTILRDCVTPPFGTVFNYVRFAQLDALRRRDDVVMGDQRSTDETEFPLLLSVVDAMDHTTLEIGFRTDLVDGPTAAAIAGQYVDALDRLARDPDGLVGSSPSVAQGPTVPDAVHQIVKAHPNAIAICQGSTSLTYAELWSWSGQVAGALRARGVGPGDMIPVLTGRDPKLVVAALGVLRAGGAYVALELTWPARRLAEICAQLAPVTALLGDVDESIADSLGVPLCTVPDPSSWQTPGPAPAQSDNAAMAVFFTSGSTGTAKGAVIAHRSLLRLLGPAGPYSFDARTQVLSVCALPWDFATLELWAPLTAGGVLRFAGRPIDALTIAEAAAAGTNTLILPTGLFHLLVEESLDVFEGIRTCLVGGERLSVTHARRFVEAYPTAELYNVYGPVETCGGSTFHRVRLEGLGGDDVSLGTAVPGDAVHVLDETLRPVPDGVVGEIVISGDGLALGYLNDLRATAAAFVTLPTGQSVGTLGYRTGDLGIRRPSGALSYRGRRDRQVKIMGIRTDLGEIEARALAVNGVTRAIAVGLPYGSSTPERLALLYTGEASEADARRGLSQSLPTQVVPRVVRRIAEIPLTDNGKTDVEALVLAAGIPTDIPATAQTSTVAGPVDRVDELVLEHAIRILGDRATSLNDDFFDRGGNSLHAIRLTTAVSYALGVDIQVVTLLAARRLDTFATIVRQVAGSAS